MQVLCYVREEAETKKEIEAINRGFSQILAD